MKYGLALSRGAQAALDLLVPRGVPRAGAFRPADKALRGYVILDFDAFDEWFEEDERNLAHPRDPFHRIEIVHSSRSVRVERDGELLAASSHPYLLFEAPLPVRYYLPPEDVSEGILSASNTQTLCAYKGRASDWSLETEADIAWSYPEPLREAAEVTDRIAFFNERVDLVVNGTRLDRRITPWSGPERTRVRRAPSMRCPSRHRCSSLPSGPDAAM